MNNREHSNRLLKCDRGDMLVATKPMHNLDYAGRHSKPATLGVPQYMDGHTFQVEAVYGYKLLAVDEDGYMLEFDRVDMASLERVASGPNVLQAVKDSGIAHGPGRL